MSRDNISNGIYILSQADLDAREQTAFRRGVDRGRLEERIATGAESVARNCKNWKNGICDTCGVQWQGCEVSYDYRCPHFTRRKTHSPFPATESRKP